MNFSLKKRFIKDMGLSIGMLKEPHFSHYIDLYGVRESYDVFVNAYKKAKEIGGEDINLLDVLMEITDGAIDHIKTNEYYQKLMEDDLARYPRFSYKNKNFYIMDNIDKIYLSIDIKKANHNALRWYDSRIVGNMDYMDFIGQFLGDQSENEYLKLYLSEAKKTRQIIYGNLNCKRIKRIQEIMRDKLIIYLFQSDLGISEDSIAFIAHDEVIFEFPAANCQRVDRLLSEPEGNGFTWSDLFSVEVFELKSIGEYFYKQFASGEKDLKTVPSYLYAQVFKVLHGLPITVDDRTFLFEGREAVFAEEWKP